MIKAMLIATPLGWMAAGYGKDGLIALTMPFFSQEEALMLLQERIRKFIVPLVEKIEDANCELAGEIDKYFKGEGYCFDTLNLDYNLCSNFAMQVYDITRQIPYGQTRSYAWIAEKLEKPGSSRAIGMALRRNPFPLIIPCHRVINSDGKMGGFSGGIELKKELLLREGVIL